MHRAPLVYFFLHVSNPMIMQSGDDGPAQYCRASKPGLLLAPQTEITAGFVITLGTVRTMQGIPLALAEKEEAYVSVHALFEELAPFCEQSSSRQFSLSFELTVPEPWHLPPLPSANSSLEFILPVRSTSQNTSNCKAMRRSRMTRRICRARCW